MQVQVAGLQPPRKEIGWIQGLAPLAAPALAGWMTGPELVEAPTGIRLAPEAVGLWERSLELEAPEP